MAPQIKQNENTFWPAVFLFCFFFSFSTKNRTSIKLCWKSSRKQRFSYPNKITCVHPINFFSLHTCWCCDQHIFTWTVSLLSVHNRTFLRPGKVISDWYKQEKQSSLEWLNLFFNFSFFVISFSWFNRSEMGTRFRVYTLIALKCLYSFFPGTYFNLVFLKWLFRRRQFSFLIK